MPLHEWPRVGPHCTDPTCRLRHRHHAEPQFDLHLYGVSADQVIRLLEANVAGLTAAQLQASELHINDMPLHAVPAVAVAEAHACLEQLLQRSKDS